MRAYLLKVLLSMTFLIGISASAFASPMDDMLLNGAQNNKIEMIELALNNGANINYRRGYNSALSFAVKNDNVEILRYLLQRGARVNSANIGNGFGGETPLMVAVERKNLDIIRLLVEAGENVNAVKDSGRTALLIAVNEIKPSIDIINYLISQKANVNQSNIDGLTPLMAIAGTYSYQNPVSIDVANILLKAGAKPNLRNKYGKTALKYAIDTNNIEMINLLLPISPKN